MRGSTRVALAATMALLLAGCAGDMAQQIMKNPNLQSQVMELITHNEPMAGQMIDKFLANDTTRTMVVDRLFSQGGASQAVMTRVANDKTMLDGVVNLAVQDTVMRAHLMSVFQGMQMMAP